MTDSKRCSMTSQAGRFTLSRRGRKLQPVDESKLLAALPKDVHEKIWMELFQKEETDLFLYEIREEIVDEAVKIVYQNYMQRQKVAFTSHCAAQAWLKIIDWHYYRHDPGEDPSAYPPCYIPKRPESWTPDDMPDPSPKDSWARAELEVEEALEEESEKSITFSSVEIPTLEEIPTEYWFPGKVNLPAHQLERAKRRAEKGRLAGEEPSDTSEFSTISQLRSPICTESEVLQKVTDYSEEELPKTSSSPQSETLTTPMQSSLQGGGDSMPSLQLRKKNKSTEFGIRKAMSRKSVPSRLGSLAGLDLTPRLTPISDCRLRSLRTEINYEVFPERVSTLPALKSKRK